ncbi:MAG TPA: S9 family peptidase [Streptosporangiaceae bacterium]|nr:S9 family peptidase [Streptosporangiaceae bacterium]
MARQIPLSVLFGNPERISPRLSPDGTRIAWIGPSDGVMNIWVAPVSTRSGVDWERTRPVTRDQDRGVGTFAWAHDNRHLLYLRDVKGDENWRLHDVDLTTMRTRDLTPGECVQARLIALEAGCPDDVLVGLNRDDRRLHDVYRLSLRTGELAKAASNTGMIGWTADAGLAIRVAFSPQPDGGMELLTRDVAGQSWRKVTVIPADDAMTTKVVTISADGRSLLLITSAGAETARLIRIDMVTGDAETIAADPGQVADVTRVRIDPKTRTPQIATLQRDRADYLVLDPSIADDLAAIRSLHPGDPVFENGDDADRTWLVSFTNDAGPIPYFRYDRAERKGVFLFDHRPELNDYVLASMEPFVFSARDGLELHGYATFPPGAGRGRLPMVLNVHGGPWTRDSWGFNSEAQWLANRGYLCLQVNFRGSTGYGKAFVNAGDREWGARMQDDLTDAVAFAVTSGWADPERVAIYGGSYGGYAALAGAAFTPGVYRCAVDIVGPSNLKTLIETIPPYWAPVIAQFHRRLGDLTDEEFLWSRSPLSRASSISIPLLIAHGANDPRVRQSESEQIVAALSAAGIDHEYLLFEDEGHDFAKPENRMKLYAAADKFLARHLGESARSDAGCRED